MLRNGRGVILSDCRNNRGYGCLFKDLKIVILSDLQGCNVSLLPKFNVVVFTRSQKPCLVRER